MKQHLLTSVFINMRPRLIATARGILADSEADVLDTLQEAFCRLWSHRDKITSESHAAGASITAVRNAAIDTLRRRHPAADITQADTADISSSDSDDSESLLEEVERIIAQQLSERDRRILYLRDRYSYDIASIAAEFDLTEANVRMVLSRARRIVRQCYLNNANK